ncbi:MAG: ABC transporter permease [Chloroflexi bacterium]|nr:ABC transporter permease [Chloroflexota bacterium]HCU73514.1 ABC transporter ATP-binding protein [Chloroflexota bacterium]|tara:strand:+ start:9043 stop:10833 length:1791 start_codon:yes stop_codon:yes gene_type:complete
MNFLRRLSRFIAPERRTVIGSVLAGLVFAGSGLIPPLLIRQILLWHADGTATQNGIGIIVIALVIAYVVRATARYTYGMLSHWAAYNVQHAMMVTLYRHIQTLPHRFFTDRRVGALVSRSVGDVETVEDFVAHGIPETVLAFALPSAMLVALFLINWPLALLAVLPMPFIIIFGRYLFPRIRSSWRLVRETMSGVTATVTEGIAGYAVVKAFGREREQLQLVENRWNHYRTDIQRAQFFSLIPAGIIELVAGIGLILVVAVGGDLTLRGLIPVADLFVFVVYLGLIYQPIIQLAAISENIQKAMASTDRVFELLEIKSDLRDQPGVTPPQNPVWSVEFDVVDFHYEATEPVLSNVSFRAEAGELVALVGPTGVGKSTCAHLVPRFYDTNSGAVRIAETDVRDVPMTWLRTNISLVLQDVFLFAGTIRDNIAFGLPNATEEQFVEAARAANVDEFTSRLPDGYDSMIGERGVRLSGGQQQRISIARAILKNSPILILDEATSSVDAETEGLIHEALDRLTKERTTLVIAHRLATVRRADRIVVLRANTVAANGTHDELLDQGGWYADMVRRQEMNTHWKLQSGPADRTTITTPPKPD